MYGEFGAGGVNIKEEYSDPSDYSSDTCSDLDWTSRSAASNGANSASGLAGVRHGIHRSVFVSVVMSVLCDDICNQRFACGKCLLHAFLFPHFSNTYCYIINFSACLLYTSPSPRD